MQSLPKRESAARRGYDRSWREFREVFLRENPLCAMHKALGHVVPACVVDHVVPHKGDLALFWDRNNLQSLCKPCHDKHKQRLEKSGTVVGCSADGLPLDPNHHWRRW